MELEANYKLENDLVNFGVLGCYIMKTEKNCIVCKGSNKEWDSYILSCYHSAHTRCYRRYLFKVDKLKCPSCGLLNWPKCCTICQNFDHLEESCKALD